MAGHPAASKGAATGGQGGFCSPSMQPNNPCDAKAVAFQCSISGQWHHVGYVGKREQHSTSCIFVGKYMYLVRWTVSGAGHYAGIAVTNQGQWSQAVCQPASTI